MIVRRRPMYWLVKPATIPPLDSRSGNGMKDEERNVRDRATVADDGCNGCVESTEPFAVLQVGGVEILGTVGEEVEPGH